MRHWWWLCLMPALCWAEPLKLAVPGLSTVDIDSQRTSFIAEHLAQELSDQGAQVVSAQDLTVMLGLERQRQLMGCTGGKCVTELTGTLGVDALVTGNVARVSGERYQLNLRMLDASSGLRVRTYTKRVVGFESLLDEMSKAARTLVIFGNKKFGRSSSPQTAVPGTRVETPTPQPTPDPGTEPAPPDPTPDQVAPAPVPAPTPAPAPTVVYVPRAYSQPSVVRQYAWVPMAAGGVCLGAGVFFLLGSDAKYRELTSGDPRDPTAGDEALRLKNQGQSQQNMARIGLSVGTTLLVTGAAMALFSSPGSVEPQVAVGPNHVSLGFAGDLPW
jgi:hypothetical protein